MALESRCQQRLGVEAARVVALLVDFTWQLGDVLLLHRSGKRVNLADALQVSARSFGVLANPVCERRRALKRSSGKDLAQRHLHLAAEVQRSRDEEQRAAR